MFRCSSHIFNLYGTLSSPIALRSRQMVAPRIFLWQLNIQNHRNDHKNIQNTLINIGDVLSM